MQLPKKLQLKHTHASGRQVLFGGRDIIMWRLPDNKWRPPDKIFV